jgi:site-specific recombinase XerD
VRNAALLAVMYRGGLRSGEALALYPKDVDRKAGTVRVLHGKGDHSRVVGLDPGAFALVERWLDRRKALGIKRTAPLFCTLGGSPLDASYVRHAVKRLAKRAGILTRNRAFPIDLCDCSEVVATGPTFEGSH